MKKLFTFLSTLFFVTGIIWGQTNVIPIRTDVVGFATWTDLNVGGTTYLQLLIAGASTITPAMNFDNYTSETLNFTARTFGGTTAAEIILTVSISTDNGSNWSVLGTRTPGSSSLTAVTSFDLSSYNGTQVKVKFSVAGTSNAIGVGIDDITITGIVATSNSSTSNIIPFSGYSYPQNIAYSSYQATDIVGGSSDIEVAKFTIQDGGGSADGDAVGTTLTSITFSLTNSANIRRIALYDGVTEVGTEVASASTATFSGITLTAADGGSKDFSIRASFNTSVTDNQNIQFAITSATADVAGSTFAAGSAGGASTDNTGDNNKIAVTADRLAFTANKPSSTITTSVNFTVEVKASDANGNTDIDQTPSITLSLASGSGNLSSTSGLTQNMSSGIYSWNDVQYNVAGTFSILISDGMGVGLTDATTISLTSQDNNLTENFNYGISNNTDLLLVTSNWTNHSGTGNPGYNATGLSYSGYASSSVGGNVTFTNINGGDINKTFSTVSSTNNIIVSFLMNLSSASASADYFFHLGPTSIGSTFRGRVLANSSGAGWNISVSKSSEAAATNATVLNFNQTYLVVMKYSFNSSTTSDDQVSLWVYDIGVPTTEGSGTPVVTIAATGSGTTGDPTDLGTVAIRQGSTTPIGSIDGIRVGTSWSQSPLPVELTSFTAVAKGSEVELAWKTAAETNNYGFEIERSRSQNTEVRNQSMTESWEKIGFIEGNGTTNSPKNYSYSDQVGGGKYSYRLKQIDRDGKFEYSNTVEATVAAIKTFGLDQNYPNPFNPSTVISYQLPASNHVTLKVYDMLGKEVSSLVNETKEAGTYSAIFDASKLSSGIYFYTLTAGNFTATKKLTLMK